MAGLLLMGRRRTRHYLARGGLPYLGILSGSGTVSVCLQVGHFERRPANSSLTLNFMPQWEQEKWIMVDLVFKRGLLRCLLLGVVFLPELGGGFSVDRLKRLD